MLTLTAKKLPNGDVSILRADQSLKITFPYWHSAKPDYRHRYVTLNCFRYRLTWDKTRAN